MNKHLHIGKKTGIFVACAILAIGVFAAYRITRDKSPQQAEGYINYGPPTEQEKSAGDNKKTEIVENEQQPNDDEQTDGNKKQATVTITDAAQYDDIIEVRSFISNHLQDGTCTILFTQGSQKLERQTPAFADASTTICTNPLIKASDFPVKGTWQVKVSYSSTNAVGESASQAVEIN